MLKLFRQKRSKGWGFTITELLVAALTGAIFLAATAGIVIRTFRIDRFETARQEIQGELTQLIDFISRDISEAIYIYNDAEPQADGSLGDGTPDMNQFLWDPGWIRRTPDSVPVVAFWKLESIPRTCYVGTPSLEAIRRGNAVLRTIPPGFDQDYEQAYWQTLSRRNSIYTLIAYYLRTNLNGAGNLIGTVEWEGNARILRYDLRPILRDNCNAGLTSFFNVDPDPFLEGFLAWPDPSLVAQRGMVPAQGNDNVNPENVMASIFSSRPGRPNLAPDCAAQFGPEYVPGGWNPNANRIPGLPAQQSDRAFYACVRQNADARLPQDVIFSATSIGLNRADPGLWRRYRQNPNNLTDAELSRFLVTNQTRVLSRGVISRVR